MAQLASRFDHGLSTFRPCCMIPQCKLPHSIKRFAKQCMLHRQARERVYTTVCALQGGAAAHLPPQLMQLQDLAPQGKVGATHRPAVVPRHTQVANLCEQRLQRLLAFAASTDMCSTHTHTHVVLDTTLACLRAVRLNAKR